MTDDEKAKDAFVLDDDSYLKTEIEKIRGRWELATVFEPVIGVDLKLTAEEIESALVKPNKSLAQLHIKLLKGIPPMSKTLNASDAWVTELCKKLSMWWPRVAEGELPLNAAKGDEMFGYKELDPTNRLLILKALCELRAKQDDIASYVNDSLKDGTEISYFRKNKIGGDGTATFYWYDGSSAIGHRLYKQVNKTGANSRMRGKASKNWPATCFQWEILATNLEEFQKVVNELSSSKVAAQVAAGKTIETDVLPIIQKFQKKKDRALKQKKRQEKLLNSVRPCTAGVTRSCRSRRPISYTYEDYDRAIDEAIKITKKRKTIEEQSNNGIHVKQGKIASSGASNMVTNSKESLGEIGDSGMSADSKDNIEKGYFSESENESDKPHEVDDDDDDSKRDHDNGSGPDKSDKEIENFGDKKNARKFGSRWSSRLAGVANHPAPEAGNLCAKNRLRQRPTPNSALDSNSVLDSDNETSSKHTNREISGHEDSPPISNSEGVGDS
ncbi:DDT DOMAIN-CONTAINING PROTEIN DDR4 [Salix purpurea]|uniref:DDT DOMAIN-CONTAINING PROTEIN DDR4 n=1 Tax=Salix purpurea TaxID=77065 RepID=A0A9Q0T274_SALPP|nr:DDT DOMAIN-CONTAINING PROTEIN DDR4 [Salix purpurea]